MSTTSGEEGLGFALFTLTSGMLMVILIVGTFVWINETAITTPTPPTATTLVAKTPAPEPPPPVEGTAVLPSFHEPAAWPESRESPTGTERRAATSRTVVGDDLEELNRNVIRLTTMVTILVEQNRPEAETRTEAPTTDDTDHHDR